MSPSGGPNRGVLLCIKAWRLRIGRVLNGQVQEVLLDRREAVCGIETEEALSD